MDSISQLALGAAVSEAMIGKQSGRKAAAWGAFLGTFPDLDVFIPMGGPIANFIYHRSFSHSFLVLGLCAPIFAWLICKIHKKDQAMRRRWFWVALAVFYTHVILDSFTVYGTQVFWPFTNYPVSIGSMFIVDPLYTIPLLIGGIVYLIKRSPLTYKANQLGLILSSTYLLWSLGVQTHVRSHANESLNQLALPKSNVLVTPAPLNTLLWRIVSIDQNSYHVGYYSIFDEKETVSFRKIESSYHMTDALKANEEVQALTRFSHGFFSIDSLEQHWVISDIRMGIEPDYVFQFAVAKDDGEVPTSITPFRHIGSRGDPSRLPKMFDRIWDDSIDFTARSH